MHSVSISHSFQVPAERLWALLADFSNLDWYSPAEHVEAVGSGIGQIRRISMPGMPGPVEEQLRELDPQRRHLRYHLLENDIITMLDYEVSMTVSAEDDESARIDLEAGFSSVRGDIDPQIMLGVVKDTYTAMFTDLDTHFAST